MISAITRALGAKQAAMTAISSVADQINKTAKDATEDAIKRATIRAFNRAKETKEGEVRTWWTKAQREQGFEAPRGRTSPDGYVPVDTSLLRNSIRMKLSGQGFDTSGLVFSDVFYAPYQEKNRGFFKAASEVAEKEYAEIFKEALDRARGRNV